MRPFLIAGVMAFAFASAPALAQTALQKDLANAVAQINNFLQQFPKADFDAAITDAQAQNPVDSVAAACWADLKTLLPQNVPAGAGIAYAIQRARDIKAMQGKINVDCVTVVPKFVTLFNTAIATAQQIGP